MTGPLRSLCSSVDYEAENCSGRNCVRRNGKKENCCRVKNRSERLVVRDNDVRKIWRGERERTFRNMYDVNIE